MLKKVFLSPKNSIKSFRQVYIAAQPELDLNYICNTKNLEEIAKNIKERKGIGDINLVHEYNKQLATASEAQKQDLQAKLLKAMLHLPNKTHPSANFEEPREIKTVGKPRQFDFKPKDFHEITRRMHLARTEQLGNLTGSRSYYLYGDLAALETALIKFSLNSLLKSGFKLISVPDILDRRIIEGCGMDTHGERTQVYSLDYEKHGGDLCLSGTSEMALAGYFTNKIFPIEQLPVKVAAVSRCFRAETSSVAEEKGIFRVHQFTKVEMFALVEPTKSEQTLEEFRSLEETNFESLGLHFKTLDMPAHELGAPAYRKYDIEAWMPGRNMYGEISSCSNCTDYQSRRLGIKYKRADGSLEHVHTINGTACAVPRMLISLVENFQNANGTIDVPDVLQRYFNGKSKIFKQKGVPELKLVKNKK